MEQVVFCTQQLNELKQILSKVPADKVFLVHGKKSYEGSGAKKFIHSLLGGKTQAAFHEFEVNPQLNDLQKGVDYFRKGTFELIIAIGGGSVLDMAKLISVFSHQQSSFTNLIKGEATFNNTKTPLIAIPTTAGTGAEATQFAVLYMGKTKYSVDHQALLPDYVYLSPDFLLEADAYLTACTGLDAFCQAVESAWSVNATEASEELAYQAIDMVWKNLPLAVLRNDASAKAKIQEGAYLAGKAINITRTTAPHALSYAFTSYYGIPHGHAVALSLPFFLQYNYHLNDSDCCDKRGADQVKMRIEKILNHLNLNSDTVEAALLHFFDALGINIRLKGLIPDLDKEIILKHVNHKRLNNNPRVVTKEAIQEFLDKEY